VSFRGFSENLGEKTGFSENGRNVLKVLIKKQTNPRA